MKKTLEILKKSVKSLSITSISVNNVIVDFKSIDSYSIGDLLNSKIVISNKWINVLVDQGVSIDEAVKLLIEVPHCYVLTSKGKFLSFNVTHHSAIALVNRFVYVYIMEGKTFELGISLENIYNEYFNDMVELIESNYKNIGNNKRVHSLIKELLKTSSKHNIENLNRIRDELSFKRRNLKHKSCNRYFKHPFLFIIQDKIVQTVELYSSCQDLRQLNKLTKQENFKEHILTLLGRE